LTTGLVTSPVADVLRALEFAAERHSAQRRKGPGGAPYVNHVIEVAATLARVGDVSDVEVLMAALLHDVIEDTDTTADEVEQRFGTRVRDLVCRLSDDKSLPKAARKRLVLEHLAGASDAVKVIKLADLCSNIRSPPVDWPTQRTREYLDWARQAAELCAGVNPGLDHLFRQRLTATLATLGTSPEAGPSR
jgi:GTP diphosphokinase / guanosine-3',5'-bis(diphosphate) 3'-diphosphatase